MVQQSWRMAYLLTLPNEVLETLIRQTNWEDQLPFATVCKRLFDCAAPILQIHREYHSRFKLVHDRDPLGIITALRLARQDPLVAWHIRKIEIFWGRDNFEQWTLRTFDFASDSMYDASWLTSKYPHIKFPPLPEIPPEEVTWQYDEIFRHFYRHIRNFTHLDEAFFLIEELVYFHRRLEDLGLDGEDVEEWMTSLKAGSDEPLKMILITICPRLTSLVYVEYEDYYSNRTPPLQLMSQVIKLMVAPTSDLSWPIGLSNIRRVNVQERPKPWWNAENEGSSNTTRGETTLLLFLPRLESLEFGMMQYTDEFTETWEDEWPHLRSTVKHLYCSEDDHGLCCELLKYCPELQSINIGWDTPNALLRDFPEGAKNSLEHVECAVESTVIQDQAGLANLLRNMPRLTKLTMTHESFMFLVACPEACNHHIDRFHTPTSHFSPSIQTIMVQPAPDEYQSVSPNLYHQKSTTVYHGESRDDRIIRHLLALAQAKPKTLPNLVHICFGHSASFIEDDDDAAPLQTRILTPQVVELQNVCASNEIQLHLSSFPNSNCCPACKPQDRFVHSEPIPADEYGELDFTWFTVDHCAELLHGKTEEALGRQLAGNHVWTGKHPWEKS